MSFEWKDIGNAVANAAPTIGGVLGGIFGATPGAQVGSLAGNAISSLLKALGLADNSTPDQVMEALKADPQALLKLKTAEMDYQLALKQKELDETKAFLADVQSARQREVEVVKATGKKDINQYILAWVIVGGFFALTGFLIVHELPKDQTGVIFMLFGALAAGFGSVMNYYFGSSKGSAEKTALLAQAEPIKK